MVAPEESSYVTNIQRFRAVRYFLAAILIGIAFVLGTICGYGDGYEAGLRHGMEMRR
jgi:hypothetical protein